ncbi:hypothetical protein Egran_00664 [Elaphomyces granulatus]|uniref:Uncharacterized protein n=1 Tax=Elaphomyces granulatus TaxID=519963 RepID=A0A232M576_9EURO|nr:hypothetical protein Egran_00664 [Elaphomyces granulatus]
MPLTNHNTLLSLSRQSPRGNKANLRPRAIERRVSESRPQLRDISPIAQQQFKPFFTLIKDANTLEYYHPTVHYIFSDDDTDLVTEAAFRALDSNNASREKVSRPRHEPLGGEAYEEDEMEGGPSSSKKPSLLPPLMPGVKDRYIILDVESPDFRGHLPGQSQGPDVVQAGAGGPSSVATSPSQQQQLQQVSTSQAGQKFKITSAHSLNPDWQVLDTYLSPAPTFDTPNSATGGESRPSSPNDTQMLRIEGTAGLSRYIPSRDNKDQSGRHQTLEEMMEQFEKRMGELRQVIEASTPVPAESADVQGPTINDTAREGDGNGAIATGQTIPI